MSYVPFATKPTCAECDGTDPTLFACYSERTLAGCVLGDNHLHMTCNRCGFAWVMDPKPA